MTYIGTAALQGSLSKALAGRHALCDEMVYSGVC